MDIAIALACALTLLTLLFLPIDVRLKGHFSLDFEKAELDVTIAGVTYIRLRLSVSEGRAILKINGKRLKKRNKPVKGKLHAVLSAIGEEMIFEGTALAMVGGDNAMASSLTAAAVAAIIAPFANNYRIFASCGDRFELDGYVKTKINAVQLASIAIKAM